MSEVIVRMEMPFSCAVCRCHADGWCYLLSIQPSECTYDSRPSWCPIIGELPEQHGDLIDRDHFKENLDMVCDAGGWLEPITQAVRVYCKKQVDAEKAIVPATERSET